MKQVACRSASFFVALGLLLLSAGISHAGVPRGKTHKPPPKTVYTAIASIDTKAMTITVEPKNSTATATRTYKISSRTQVTVNGQPGTLADLKPGLQIRIGAGMDADVAEELSASAPPPNPK